MRIFIDTNVLLDALLGRQPFSDQADRILKLCADKKIQGFMGANSILDMFYIMRKDFSPEARKKILLNLCSILEVEKVDMEKIKAALENSAFSDLEDCVQFQCARATGADYIITRNIKDFLESDIKTILPGEFLEQYFAE